MNMSPQPQKQKQGREVITSIEPNDVLLGRGNHVHNPANAKFRELVLSRSAEYWSCDNNVTKHAIARQIIDTTISLGGRFLRKVRNSSKNDPRIGGAASGATDDTASVPSDAWEVADTDTIFVKVKQTFRDFTASSKKKAVITGRNSQSEESLTTIRQPTSITLREVGDISNTSGQVPTTTTTSSNLEHSILFPAATIHHNLDNRSDLSILRNDDFRNSIFPAAHTSPMDKTEFFARQRLKILRQQQQLRQQESSLLHNLNRQRNEQISSLVYSNTLQDQLLLRQLLSQQTQPQSSQDTSMLAAIGRQQRPTNLNVLPNTSQSMQFARNFGNANLEQSRLVSHLEQQLLGNVNQGNYPLSVHNSALTHSPDTNQFRQLSTIPAHETSILPSDITGPENFYNTAIATALTTHQRLMANSTTTGVPLLAAAVGTEDSGTDDGRENDDDKKPPGKRK